MSPISFSIIIPAYNEEKELPYTFQHLQYALSRFQTEIGGQVEIIVVNNNSSDQTAEIAKKLGAKVIFEEKRQIARARNCGGTIAQGNILLFCDADTHLHPNTLVKIYTLMNDQKLAGGGIKIAPDELNKFNRTGLFLWNIVSELIQISGGTLFCRKKIFNDLDGFSEKFYIGEEVLFQLKMKLYCLRNNTRTILLPDCIAVTSMRKIREYGLIRYGWAVLRCFMFPWLATNKKFCALWYNVRKTTH